MVRRGIPVAVIMLIASCVPVLGFDPAVPAAERNAILFSWDGVQREHLMECLSRNELPNLAALIREGNIVNIDVTSHRTETKPGHVQMLTGYDPDITGTPSNGEFRAIPEGLSIFERLEKAFGDDNITTVFLTGGLHQVGSCPPSGPATIEKAREELKKLDAQKGGVDPLVREKWHAMMINKRGEPFYHVSKNADVWNGEYRRSNVVIGHILEDYLDRYAKDRFFIFCHTIDTDHAGHEHGENSKEYNDMILASDRRLGEAIRKLKELGIYDKTMVFVNSDHGFNEGTNRHFDAPHVFLAGNLKSLTKNGDQRDVTPTILTEMGVDISELRPKYKGTALTR